MHIGKIPRTGRLAALAMLAACARPLPPLQPVAGFVARAPLSPEQLAGCYRVLRADGTPFETEGSWSYGIELTLGRATPEYEARVGHAVYEYRLMDRHRSGSRPLRSQEWYVRGADTLVVTSTAGFVGDGFAVGPAPDGLRGEWTPWSDVVYERPPRVPIWLQRVACRT